VEGEIAQPAPPRNGEQQRGYAIVTGRQCAAAMRSPARRLMARRPRPHPRRCARDARRGRTAQQRAWLERWIADPQAIKPGNRMPKVR
jgi:cytochrome c1